MRKAFTILILLPLFVKAQINTDVQKYIERYRAIAVEEMIQDKIPACITLAQGIHESTCGKSKLSLNSNNHFGIKCHKEWIGPTYKHDDDAPQECFRVYEKPEDSYRDHSDFLRTRPRYSFLFDLNMKDYKAWAKGLKAAGYATNPNYPSIIIKLIEDYKLYEYDRLPDSVLQVITTSTKPVETEKIYLPEEKKQLELYHIIVNGVRAISYNGKMNLTEIAQQENIPLEKLYTINDHEKYEKFKKDENIFLEEKKEECDYRQYVLETGETMRDVAQKFGIKVTALLERNKMKKGDIPMTDEVVVLRGTREYPIRLKNLVVTKIVSTKTHKTYTKFYTVEEKDTLFSIAQRYNVSLSELKKWNALKSNALKPGQR